MTMPPVRTLRRTLRDWWLGGDARYAYSRPRFRRTPAEPPKVRVLGDHSNYHCGSWAAIESIRQNCQRAGYRLAGRYEAFDILVVNGEGSMHGSRHGFRNVFTKKMEVLKMAVEAGKPAYLVNTIWQDNVADYDDVLRRLSGIQVREAGSQRALREEHGIAASVKIDASNFLTLDLPRVTRGEGVLVTDFFLVKEGRFERRNLDIAGAEHVSMADETWPSLLGKLAASRLLVTGRHHAVYAACRTRTPFVVLKGNNHKVTALLAMAGVRLPVADDLSEIPALMNGIEAYRGDFERLFDWMEAQPDTPILPPARS